MSADPFIPMTKQAAMVTLSHGARNYRARLGLGVALATYSFVIGVIRAPRRS